MHNCKNLSKKFILEQVWLFTALSLFCVLFAKFLQFAQQLRYERKSMKMPKLNF